ncbi:hypothetical protein PENSPDRAFT_616858 [Peniophora sp. CONT]|nr:hypothetical protein PENSPDRAFT_616858 [Peniophora sp. CONT]
MAGLNPTALDDQFNANDAELVLRPSDGVDFADHRTVLQLASPIFRDMLSLPQPSTSTYASSRTVISMAEDAPSLRLLLRYNYPRAFCPEPDLSVLEDIKRTASLALKYDIVFMREAVEKALIRYAQNQPDVAYVVAWRYEYPDALRAAARRSLDPYVESLDAPEFDEVPASALSKLRKYERAVPDALRSAMDSTQAPIDDCINWAQGIENTQPLLDDLTRADPECTCAMTFVCFSNVEEQGFDGCSVPIWWFSYTRSVFSRLWNPDRPAVDHALSQPFTGALETATRCQACRQRGVWNLLETTKATLRAEIETRLSEVPIDAPFIRKGN